MEQTIYLEVDRKSVDKFLDFITANGLKVIAYGSRFEDFDGYIFTGKDKLENKILSKLFSNLPAIREEFKKYDLTVERSEYKLTSSEDVFRIS